MQKSLGKGPALIFVLSNLLSGFNTRSRTLQGKVILTMDLKKHYRVITQHLPSKMY